MSYEGLSSGAKQVKMHFTTLAGNREKCVVALSSPRG